MTDHSFRSTGAPLARALIAQCAFTGIDNSYCPSRIHQAKGGGYGGEEDTKVSDGVSVDADLQVASERSHEAALDVA